MDRWTKGLGYAREALTEFSNSLRDLEALAISLNSVRLWDKRLVQTWIADCDAWLQTVIASVVRDVFVHPLRVHPPGGHE